MSVILKMFHDQLVEVFLKIGTDDLEALGRYNIPRQCTPSDKSHFNLMDREVVGQLSCSGALDIGSAETDKEGT